MAYNKYTTLPHVFRAVILALLVAAPLAAQPQRVNPSYPAGVTAPLFIVPASGVGGGGTVTTACLTWPLTTKLCEEAANYLIQRNSTAAQRWSVANTYTSASNNELFSVDWQTTAGVARVGTFTAATGTGREMRLVAQGSSGANEYTGISLRNTSAPFIRILPRGDVGFAAGASSATGNWVEIGAGSSVATSGSVVRVAITPTYNQTSGSAANTDLLIQRTETAIGSGAQLLIDAQVGVTSKFSVNNAGVISTTAPIAVASGFGAGAAFATGSNVAAFDLNVGTTPGTSGVVTLPAAAHGWTCRVDDITTIADRTYVSANSTTSATFTTTIGWSNNDHLVGSCTPY